MAANTERKKRGGGVGGAVVSRSSLERIRKLGSPFPGNPEKISPISLAETESCADS